MINLSLQGCGVESTTRVPVGTSLEVRILIPDYFFPASIDRAIVLWSSEHRFGMKFIRMQSEVEARLRRVLKQEPKHRNGTTACVRQDTHTRRMVGAGFEEILGATESINCWDFWPRLPLPWSPA